MIAQMRSASLQAHRGRVRICGADAQVGGALVISTHFSLWPAQLGDPVVPGGIVLSQFLVLGFAEADWEWRGDWAGNDLGCSGFSLCLFSPVCCGFLLLLLGASPLANSVAR